MTAARGFIDLFGLPIPFICAQGEVAEQAKRG